MAESNVPGADKLSSSYRMLAANTIEGTYNLRSTTSRTGSDGLDRAAVFADVLGVTTMQSTHEPLTASTSEQTLRDGSHTYTVSLRDRLGGGIDYVVGSDLAVNATPIQGFGDGRTQKAQTEIYRWNGQDPKNGFLEHAVNGHDKEVVFVPYANPSLSGGDDAEGGMKFLVEQGIAAYGSGQPGRPPVLMAAEAEASYEGVRAISGHGEFGKLKNGYAQDGPITYNGFSVVEQAGPHGESTFYNKHDLLRNASGRTDFDQAIASGKPIEISIHGTEAAARMLDSHSPDLHVFRNGKQETLSAGFSQTGKLFAYGALVAQETDVDGHKSITMFSRKELFANRSEEESHALRDAIQHHKAVTLGISHHAVSVHVAESAPHAKAPAHDLNIARNHAPGIDR